MTWTSSLPMYNPPGMRAANAAFWDALRTLLQEAGLKNLPDTLDFARRPVPDDIGPEIGFSQTCGYPLLSLYSGQYQLLARPWYDAPGCSGPTHSAFIIVPEASPARRVADLRGKRFGLNTLHSNSGMNLPRLMLARAGVKAPFFGEVIETGGHGPSLKALQEGRIDCASIDCLTFVFGQDYQPDQVDGLRILAQTPSSPTIPFVTSVETDPAMVAVLKQCLLRLSDDPRFGAALGGLRISRIEAAPEAEYRGIMKWEREAADLGYPDLL